MDPAAELLLLAEVVSRSVDYVVRARGLYLPRRKARIAALAELDPIGEP